MLTRDRSGVCRPGTGVVCADQGQEWRVLTRDRSGVC